ncbi:MAG: hypothetical protein KIT84_28765 [Labilithrix sp.]|nr:hypothetical protein [Labilithrix sp.]MCW5815053.1 hypothetical protein [Labilithrix sp.]
MRKEFLSIAALSVGLFAGLGLSIPLARGDAKPRTIGVDEIKDGMKGYGLTVFKGTEPERFDVEVVGVLRNFRPSQALILVNTKHPRLAITKNVRGMSGSPIYLDNGRLAGAYAYSWSSFQVEPIAGVTPIEPMLTEMNRPIPPGFWPLEGGAPLPGRAQPPKQKKAENDTTGDTMTAWSGTPGAYDVGEHSRQIAARLDAGRDPSSPVRRAATPLMLGGMSDRSMKVVRELFEPLGLEPMQAGGGGAKDPNAPLHYVDGGGVGVEMARGDVSLMGLGTVTHVSGTKLCGFGHPMMEAGVTALPTAIGRVHWIFASEQHSSKIGEAARSLGALVQDRQSSIVVDEAKTAPVFPLSATITGATGIPKTVWNTEIAEERFMSPGITASVLGSILDASVNERRDVTWKITSKVTVQNHGTVVIDDFGVATGGMPDASEIGHAKVTRLLGDVLNNPWEQVHIQKVETTIAVDYARDLVRLRGVDVLDPVVDVNEKVRLRVHLVPFAGPEQTKVLELTMPSEVAGKEVELEIVPGYTVTPDVASPQGLSDLLANSTKQSLLPKSIVVQYRTKSVGVAYQGHVAQKLPAFAVDLLRPTASDIAPDAFPSYTRTITPLDRYVEGSDRVKVKVRPIYR